MWKREKTNTHPHSHIMFYNEFRVNLRWIHTFWKEEEPKKMLCLSAGRWSVRWIRYNEMHIPFYSFLFGGACVSLSLSLSFRLFASNLNFPFVYLFDSFIVFFSLFAPSSFFLFLSISFCRSWITLLFWLWPRPRAHTLFLLISFHSHTQMHRYFLCRQRFSFQNIFDNFFGLAVFTFGKMDFRMELRWMFWPL